MKKYEVVEETIKKRILTGEYKPQTLLPSQDALAKEFQVSKITIKSALDHLAHAGLVYKESGLGTCVLSNGSLYRSHDAPVSSFAGLSAEQGKEHVSSQVLDFDVSFPDDDLCQKLNLAKTDPVYKIIRLRKLDGEPFLIEHTFMPVSQVPALTEQILEHSIYSYLHKQLHIKFGGAFRKINAALPDEYDRKYLGATNETPIMEIEQIVWTNGGVNIEYSRSRNLYNKRSYIVVESNQ